MIIEQDGRRLLQIVDDDEWQKLPKDMRAMPVYFRKTPTGIDVWPMWPDHFEYPDIRVSP